MIHGALSVTLAAVVLSFTGHPPPDPTALAAGATDTLRTLQPDDLLRLNRLGEVRFSPDGDLLAFERARSAEEGPTRRVPERPEPRSDIWIASAEADTPRRLTDGHADGTGWFNPRWSPDGTRLAFLSMNAQGIRAWIWDRDTDEIRLLGDRAIHLTSVGPLLFHWVSDRELAVAVRPEGAPERNRLLAESGRSGMYAAERWEASWSGLRVTADVLDSNPAAGTERFEPRSEVRIYRMDGTWEKVAEGRFGLAWPSPDGRWLATLSHPPVGTVPPGRPIHQRMGFGIRPGAVPLTDPGALAAGGTGRGTAAASLPAGEAIHRFLFTTVQWAPDGHGYAFFFQSASDEDAPPARRVGLYRPAVDELRVIGDADTEVRSLAWTGDSRLLVRARRAERSGDDGRMDWWQVSPEGEWENLTTRMDQVPAALIPVPGAAAGLVDGELWRVGGDRGLERLRPEGDVSLEAVVWPTARGILAGGATGVRAPDDPIGLRVRSSAGPEVQVVRVVGSSLRPVARIPLPQGQVRPDDVAVDPAQSIFSRTDESGTWLLRQHGGSIRGSIFLDTLVAEDRWLARVEAGETRRVTYAGPDERTLSGWVILPPGAHERDRHPAVVSIYPGRTYGEREPADARLNRIFGIAALQLLASRGYAVVLPSIPLEADDPPRPKLAERVLPAVDAAVDSGFVDPDRVGVMGHSFGGWGVNHLISQTDRFQAAVSAAGFSHLRSHYGTLDARGRYGHMARPEPLQLVMMGYFESGQGGMGAPPFEAPERYRQASPLSWVQEVDTPLLLIHGDHDFIPLQQAEMLFTELMRQGKRTRLVRYAGEGHTVNGGANVLDMWDRMFEWWGEFLGRP